jgi:hypothetical protein
VSLRDDKQQNIQIELDFSAVLTGEARGAGMEAPPDVMWGWLPRIYAQIPGIAEL